QIVTYPVALPFSEWILNRVRKMGYPKQNDLSYLHEVVAQPEVFRVTKQLCADTNLPEFRRMVNNFVREVAIPKGKLRKPVEVQRCSANHAADHAGFVFPLPHGVALWSRRRFAEYFAPLRRRNGGRGSQPVDADYSYQGVAQADQASNR